MNTDTHLISLTQGKFAIVDSVDYEFLMQWKWSAHKVNTSYGYRWYAVRQLWPEKKATSMHREVAKRSQTHFDKSKSYDHADRNGLNNTRENIRQATRSQNAANSTKAAGKSSQFKGVSWNKLEHKWKAYIKLNQKMIHLGTFSSEADAAQAYLNAATRYFGEFAHLSKLPTEGR